jgi:hypothetical protein
MTTQVSALHIWAEKQMREVTEGVRPCSRIVLTSDNITWEKWEPVIGLDPAQWCAEAEALLNALAEELPKRRVQMTFTAEDTTGATLATHLRSVQGKNQQAADLGTQAGAKALADGIASIAKTCEATLGIARNMMEFQASQLSRAEDDLKTRGEELRKAHELLAMIQKIEIEEGVGANPVGDALAAHVNEAAPLALQAIQYWLEKRQADLKIAAAKPAAAAVVKTPIAAAAAPTNGTAQ